MRNLRLARFLGAILMLGLLLPAISASASPRSRLESIPLEEPLIAAGPTLAQEDEALLEALTSYLRQPTPDDPRALETFLSGYPHSGWRVALLTNLGLLYYHYGYFSKAVHAWECAWQEGRPLTEQRARAVVDRAVGELARLHSSLGHGERLEALFREIGTRPVTGPATEALQGAREALLTMRTNPGISFLCGPMALKNLLLARGASLQQTEFLSAVRSGPRGLSLAEVERLAEKAHLRHRLIFREAGQSIPVPAIIHWKVSHYAAIVEEAAGRFHIEDPTFGQDLWVTRAALESESSGYFLVPSQTIQTGWRNVSAAEANQVRGMGLTPNTEALDSRDKKAKACSQNAGMCGYNINEMAVSLYLSDNPVGYAPPRGPSVYVTLTYNQRDGDQPANFAWFNVSPKWTLNWLTYIQDDPTNARANALRYVAGGGSVTYTGFNTTTNAYTRETRDASLLVRTSANPITYERRLADGGREVYSHSNGATTNPRRVFLTQIIDPAGNAVTLNYDTQLRLTSVVDATNRSTKFSYESTTRPLLVTSITDPFGRSARIGYDGSGRLVQITDVLGMASQFSYDASNLVNAMTTPYGTTRFKYGQIGADLAANGALRFLEITDPLGFTERVEFRNLAPGIIERNVFFSDVPKNMPTIQNDYLAYRNTFYWDKHAYPLAYAGTPSYTKARLRHWLHLNLNMASHMIESSREPNENRVWFEHPGQAPLFVGTLDNISGVGRVLDDGTSQVSTMEYDAEGHLTRSVDPLNRETRLDYDTNGIDLLRIRQKTGASVFATMAELTYNAQHLPLTVKDAAGQVTTYAYNSAGQPVQITDAVGQTTRFEYDSLGYLTRIVNPNGQTAENLTYDAFGRIATSTDSEGRTVSFAYDALDRVTQEIYPDGSTREYTWDKLDLAAVRDRQGRITRYSYDAVRNLIAITDPLGRKTIFGYYENGALKSLTDPNGNTTTWDIDLQNRVTAKHYPDGTQATYTYEATTSRLKTITDALGQKKQFTYTQDNQLAGISYPNAINPTSAVRFSYDPYFRRIVSMTDGAGTTQYRYQPPGEPGALRLLEADGPRGNDTVAYQYDALGRMIGRSVNGSSETFAYDPLGRLVSHSGPLGAFDLSYLGQTRLSTSVHAGDGSVGTDRTYDANTGDRRLIGLNNSAPSRSYQLSATPENAITQIGEVAADGSPWPAQTWGYSYDEAGRLLQGQSSGGAQYAYGHDSADNIISQQRPDAAILASYDAANRITDFGGNAFVYDANGNLTDDGERSYQWDAENRLIGVVSKSQPDRATGFRYDGLGRRIAIVSAAGVETRYLWCGDVLCQARDSSDAITRRYYPEGELSSNGRLYYARDHLGSVRDVLSLDDGSRVASFDYDPYGNPTQTDGAAASDFRFAGMFYHPDSGLYLTRRRAYDPRSARWLSRDPVGERGGANLYAYVDDQPVTMVDPRGSLGLVAAVVDGFAGMVEGGISGYQEYGLQGLAAGVFVGGLTGVVVGFLSPDPTGLTGIAATGAAISYVTQVGTHGAVCRQWSLTANVSPWAIAAQTLVGLVPFGRIAEGLAPALKAEFGIGAADAELIFKSYQGVLSGLSEAVIKEISGSPEPDPLYDPGRY